MIPGDSARRVGATLALVVLLAGCPTSPDPTPQSRRISNTPPDVPSSEPVPVGGIARPVDDPVTWQQLGATDPALAALPDLPRQVATGILNLQPAPCVPCQGDHRSLARCALELPPGCENVPGLVARAVRLAAAGASPGAVQATLTYNDRWLPVAGPTDPGWPLANGPIQVELWVDPSFGAWRDAAGRAQQLVDEGRKDPDIGLLSVHVCQRAHWELVEKPAPAGSDDALRAVAAADLQGSGLPYLVALAAAAPQGVPGPDALRTAAQATAGLDIARWQSDRTGPPAATRLAGDKARFSALGFSATPSWRVNGYALRGHRSLDAVRDVVENERIDSLQTLPGALLAPWSPNAKAPAGDDHAGGRP